MSYHIRVTKEFGRGLYVKEDSLYLKNQVIMSCEILPLSKTDTIKLEDTALKLYKFKMTDTEDCIVLGDGSLFNHSDKPNVNYFFISRPHRIVMVFVATRTIHPKEQLFINYTQDDKSINIKDYL